MNDQAIGTDINLDLTEDMFSSMFDDVIQSPSITHEKQEMEIDNVHNITTKEFISEAVMGNSTMRAHPSNSTSKSSSEVSPALFPSNNTQESSFQLNDGPKVPSRNTPYTMENASNLTSANMNNPSEKTAYTTTNASEKHNSPHQPSATITLPPKKKRRPRAKKILTASESLIAREKYLEKNRRAARKCRMKKKAEMACDQARYEYYANEIRATKLQLGACQKELLDLIEICKGMVREGCADRAVRRFVGNWERREEACRGMLESGDLGVECWKLVERCRGARLGEGVLGDVDNGELVMGEEGRYRGDGNIGMNDGENKTWMVSYCGMKNGMQEQSRIQDDTPLIYNSSGLTETGETISHGSCRTSPVTHQPHQPHQPQTTKWQNISTTLQEATPVSSSPPQTHKNPTNPTNHTIFSTPSLTFTPQSMNNPSPPFKFTAKSPLNKNQSQHQSQHQNQQQKLRNPTQTPSALPKDQTQTQRKREIRIVPRTRHESIDSGYGSICSTHSVSNSNSNSDFSAGFNSNPDSSSWSPDFASTIESSIGHSNSNSNSNSSLAPQIQTQTHPPNRRKISPSSCRDFVYENLGALDLVDPGPGFDSIDIDLDISNSLHQLEFQSQTQPQPRILELENSEVDGGGGVHQEVKVEEFLGPVPTMESLMEMEMEMEECMAK